METVNDLLTDKNFYEPVFDDLSSHFPSPSKMYKGSSLFGVLKSVKRIERRSDMCIEVDHNLSSNLNTIVIKNYKSLILLFMECDQAIKFVNNIRFQPESV